MDSTRSMSPEFETLLGTRDNYEKYCEFGGPRIFGVDHWTTSETSPVNAHPTDRVPFWKRKSHWAKKIPHNATSPT